MTLHKETNISGLQLLQIILIVQRLVLKQHNYIFTYIHITVQLI